MSRIINLPIVVALAATVAACDTTEAPKTSQRDVYNSLEDCIADWGDQELCEREIKNSREHEEKMAQARAAQGGGGVMPVPMIFGPTYYGDSRSVSHNGRTIAPATSSSSRTVNYTTSPAGNRVISYTAPRPPTPSAAPSSIISRGVSSPSPSVTRGGFGSSGASSSASS